MREDSFEQFLQVFRKRLQKTLADCNSLIADAGSFAQRRPQLAPRVAPDELIEAYTIRQWAHKALAALDAGDEIPPPPDHLCG